MIRISRVWNACVYTLGLSGCTRRGLVRKEKRHESVTLWALVLRDMVIPKRVYLLWCRTVASIGDLSYTLVVLRVETLCVARCGIRQLEDTRNDIPRSLSASGHNSETHS